MDMNGRIPLTIIGSLLIAGFSMGATDCGGGGATDAGTRPGDDGGTPMENCTNRADDDGDGRVDCFDSDCTSDPSCSSVVEVCTDRVDNDRDGATDCADSDCAGDPACPTATTEDCDNGVDDDGDGAVDCDDPECARAPSCASVSEICDNLVDDDGDGDIDCADSECADTSTCTVRPCSATDTCIYSDAQIAEANRVCGLVSGCLGAAGFLQYCVHEWLRASTAEQYRDRFDGTTVSSTDIDLDRGWWFWFGAVAEPESRACLGEASTCFDVSVCLNDGDASSAGPCTGNDWTCDGSTLRTCMRPNPFASSRMRFALDCADAGLSCFDGPRGGCATAVCDERLPTCDGNREQNCFDGLMTNTPCGAGTACTVGGPEDPTVILAYCRGTGATCDESTFVARCEADGQITHCAYGQLATGPCALDLVCGVIEGQAACIPDEEPECEPEGTVTCDPASGRMTTCFAWSRGEIDCSALGFTSCGTDIEGVGPVCR